MNDELSPLVAEIYEARARMAAAEPPRNYLGMSSIGDACLRRLRYRFEQRPADLVDGKAHRIYDVGHSVEARVKAELREAGCVIADEQLEISDFGGVFKGHVDGVIYNTPYGRGPYVLEIKSAKDSRWKEMVKAGIPIGYQAQLQIYMGYSGIPRALFIVENKNDQRLWDCVVGFLPAEFDALREKAARVIEQAAFDRLEGNMAAVNCRYCDYRFSCLEDSK